MRQILLDEPSCRTSRFMKEFAVIMPHETRVARLLGRHCQVEETLREWNTERVLAVGGLV